MNTRNRRKLAALASITSRKLLGMHGSGITNLFKFSDIIEQSQTLIFYSTSMIQRMHLLKKAMRNVKDVTRLGGVAVRMMDKYLGDRTGFIEVSNHCSLLLKEHNFTAQTKTYKRTPISTKRITEYLALANKHPAFVEF